MNGLRVTRGSALSRKRFKYYLWQDAITGLGEKGVLRF